MCCRGRCSTSSHAHSVRHRPDPHRQANHFQAKLSGSGCSAMSGRPRGAPSQPQLLTRNISHSCTSRCAPVTHASATGEGDDATSILHDMSGCVVPLQGYLHASCVQRCRQPLAVFLWFKQHTLMRLRMYCACNKPHHNRATRLNAVGACTHWRWPGAIPGDQHSPAVRLPGSGSGARVVEQRPCQVVRAINNAPVLHMKSACRQVPGVYLRIDTLMQDMQ